MNAGIFYAAGFAVLIFLEKQTSLHETGSQNSLPVFLREGGFIFAVSGLFFSLDSLVSQCPAIAAYQNEFGTFVFLPLAYAASRILRKTDIFFLTVFGFFTFAKSQRAEFSFSHLLSMLAILSLAVIFIPCLLTGLKRRLLLSPIPKPVTGLPILLLTTALLLLALSGVPAVFGLPLSFKGF